MLFRGVGKSKNLGGGALLLDCIGKSLSETLIFASTNPQYDDRLFIDLPVLYMKTASSEHGENMFYPYSPHVQSL